MLASPYYTCVIFRNKAHTNGKLSILVYIQNLNNEESPMFKSWHMLTWVPQNGKGKVMQLLME